VPLGVDERDAPVLLEVVMLVRFDGAAREIDRYVGGQRHVVRYLALDFIALAPEMLPRQHK
jgi:hypothetical protein